MAYEALLFSIDDSIDTNLRTELRKNIEGGDPNLEVFDLDDVEHEIDYEVTFAGKLNEMLSRRINRVFLINSPNLHKVLDESYFTVDYSKLKDISTQEVVKNIFSSEQGKERKESKLVLLSLSQNESVPTRLQNIEHICMVNEAGNIDVHKVNIIIGLSRLERKNIEKPKKKDGCIMV